MEWKKFWEWMTQDKRWLFFTIFVLVAITWCSNSKGAEYTDVHGIVYLNPYVWNATTNDGNSIVCVLGHITDDNRQLDGTALLCADEKRIQFTPCQGHEQLLQCKHPLFKAYIHKEERK